MINPSEGLPLLNGIFMVESLKLSHICIVQMSFSKEYFLNTSDVTTQRKVE